MGNTNNSGADCQSAVGIIYLLTCTVNGKQYVGQTRQKLSDRIRQHKNGTKYSAIDMAIQKHGWKNFTVEVLETCPVELLNEREIFWIHELQTRSPNGYNLTDGGDGNSNPSEEIRAKISANHADVSGENNPNYGRPRSPETCEKIAAAHRGKKLGPQSPETRKRISEALKGKPSKLKGKPRSPETRKKISESRKGMHPSEEARKKMSASQKAAWARRKKALENGGDA